MSETSLSVKSKAQDGTKGTTTLSYVNPNASDSTLLTYAQKLASLTTDEYQGSTKITKTDLDEAAEKLEPNIRLCKWDITGGGTTAETVTPSLSDTDAGNSYGFLFNGDGDCYVRFISGTVDSFIVNESDISGDISATLGDSDTVTLRNAFSLKDTNPITSNGSIVAYVPATDTYQEGTLVVTLSGGDT